MKTIIQAQYGWMIFYPQSRSYVPVIAWEITQNERGVETRPITLAGVQSLNNVFRQPNLQYCIPGKGGFFEEYAVLEYFKDIADSELL